MVLIGSALVLPGYALVLPWVSDCGPVEFCFFGIVIARCFVFVVFVFVCLVLWLVFASAIYDGDGLN